MAEARVAMEADPAMEAVKAVEAEPVAPGVEATAERGIAASQWAAVAARAV